MSITGLFCTKCGELNEPQAQFCRKCGAPQTGVSSAASSAPRGSAAAAVAPAPTSSRTSASYDLPTVPPAPAYGGVPGVSPPPNAAGMFRGYGGFWIRLLAIIIDGVVLNIVMVPLWMILLGGVGALSAAGSAARNPEAVARAVLALVPLVVLAGFAINWLYEALLTSSSKQGTLGKMALGLKVVDKNGDRLSFLHATGRYFAKLINQFTLGIGYLMAGFTERKQALHDMIAGTFVIKM